MDHVCARHGGQSIFLALMRTFAGTAQIANLDTPVEDIRKPNGRLHRKLTRIWGSSFWRCPHGGVDSRAAPVVSLPA